ncbi:MAG: hypothetical protein NTW19_12550 [Planctomycetota bacterium]|nr:hypothetical protein [Planctomycetota bacterium]
MTPAPDILAPDGWWWAALTGPVARGCMAVGVVSLVGIALACVVVWRLGAPGRAATRGRILPALVADARATATIELALVFPLMLFLALTLAQTTYLMGDNLFVHYASFSAARAAIVQIPLDRAFDGEPANAIIDAPSLAKHEAIRAAAVAALVPAAGLLETGTADGDVYAAGLTQHYAAYGMAPPAWIAATAASRYRYANAPFNTAVNVCRYVEPDPAVTGAEGTLVRLPADAAYTFGPRDAVGVIVTHQVSLSVPYVSMIFSSGLHTPATGRGRYATVSASCILTNEGVVDALPPLPTLPRDP